LHEPSGARAALVSDLTWRAGSARLADGTNVRTFETGNPEPGAPAVVMVHGMGHWTQAAWSRLATHFANSRRVVAFDLPGFGASEKPDAS
jgi:pimeloyl-ACP methyl ester carboxylesterase